MYSVAKTVIAKVVGVATSRSGRNFAGYKGTGRKTSVANLGSVGPGELTIECPAVVPRGVKVGLGVPQPGVRTEVTRDETADTGNRFSFTVFAPRPTDREPVEVVANPVAANKGDHLVGPVPLRQAGGLVGP